ncbi:hypothetical protein OS493_031967 [Desmophyllum pertusum]|uniref:Uncharacterized protein n=1 Tax=Desmophyllum pertusum TaxID=174260 RepID=A0A9W9ZL19_9CNID|nr:hypothetical protein OS493_031967 [Desmophyllum pertusum]
MYLLVTGLGRVGKDLDPCIDVTCHYHCLCKSFGAPRDARSLVVSKWTAAHLTKNPYVIKMARSYGQ